MKINIGDASYPLALKEIAVPPQSLHVMGDVAILSRPQIAIVGARRASPVGLQAARQIARELSDAGFIVTSGLALGIDGAAHQGAMDAKAPTVAVLGTGLNYIYPKKHQKLADAILETGGAIVSEYPPDTPPVPHNFPKRNRIISGLSLGVLVVEAAIQSGSLITARQAIDQNRDVFAMPGSSINPLARGGNYLIKQGAKLVETTQDILDEYPQHVNSSHLTGKVEDYCTHLTKREVKLLNTIKEHTTSVDEMIRESGFDTQTVLSLLLELELHDHIQSTPGGYIRLRRAKHERECA